jgi:hypothetical protein
VNGVQAREFLAAAAASDAKGSYAGPRALVESAAEAAPEAEWHVAVSGASASALRLGLLKGAAVPAARDAAARTLRVDRAALDASPASSRPWLDAAWDAARGAWTRVEVARAAGRHEAVRALAPKPGRERVLRTRPFSAAAFDEPIASALKTFSALEPVAAVQSEKGSAAWTLALARPVAWPRFLRCDLSAPFAPRAAALSLLLRDARLVALDFDGEALWARLVG